MGEKTEAQQRFPTAVTDTGGGGNPALSACLQSLSVFLSVLADRHTEGMYLYQSGSSNAQASFQIDYIIIFGGESQTSGLFRTLQVIASGDPPGKRCFAVAARQVARWSTPWRPFQRNPVYETKNKNRAGGS